jgi:hypothetical protein
MRTRISDKEHTEAILGAETMLTAAHPLERSVRGECPWSVYTRPWYIAELFAQMAPTPVLAEGSGRSIYRCGIDPTYIDSPADGSHS